MPLGTFKGTRHLGKFKVKKLDGGNLKAVDDQLEDVDYNDNYEDVDDDLKKDDGQIEKSCRHRHQSSPKPPRKPSHAR